MRVLLDTQVWLWLQTDPDRIASDVHAKLAEETTELIFSAASTWEVSIKYALGKLALPQPPKDYIPARMQHYGMIGLPITHTHTLHVATLPHLHGDPFDRLLIAQSQLEGISLVTSDRQIKRYDVDVIAAQ